VEVVALTVEQELVPKVLMEAVVSLLLGF